ncbi:hypothetical protein Patl1_34459 [Pistacia atlantica]|uniref:Uncharacterized protein n=1 Tax=Pistacia atlantica TaxID=434234 RepID=A0ACC0ZTX1_9ROSI|nr:hypothetical protein Patl1_34459 [Pistacia atlantica]
MFTSLPHTNSYSHNHKPHKANQPAWLAMKRLQQQHGQVGLHHFQLLHLVGSGNIANVYVCKVKQQPAVELLLPHRLYAMKVVDREASSVMNKKHRVEMEKKILRMLDHPFLPTLYAEFDASRYSCLVMEYCPDGDLLTVLQKQPRQRLSVASANSSNLKQCDRQEMEKAHDLIRKLLMKNPKKRMGSLWGALEIKNHEFFRGVNWALIRSVKPREIPEFTQKLINKDTTKVPDLHVDCF